MSLRSLDPQKILSTVQTLSRRVRERLPNASLVDVAEELVAITQEALESEGHSGRRARWLRMFLVLSLGLMTIALAYASKHLEFAGKELSWAEFAQGIEAGVNDIILVAAALYFLFSLEGKIERRAVLKKLHELRSLAHVVDMHQLTKDPERVSEKRTLTQSSPKYNMTSYELTRYLDYCSEMLSLIGKLAALHGKDSSDSVVLTAVDEVESLSNSLSRKIWQKIMIILSTQPAGKEKISSAG